MEKTTIATIGLLIVFVILIFISPFMESMVSSQIWVIFFALILLLLIISMIVTIIKKRGSLIEGFKKQPTVIKILEVLFFIALIYEFIAYGTLIISPIIMFLMILYDFIVWFRKEED